MLKLLLATLLVVPCCNAQVVSVQAGAGDLYSGDVAGGVGLSLYRPNSTTQFGVGVLDHHVMLSGSELFEFRGYTVQAGTESLGFSAGGVGIGFANLGVSVSKHTDKTIWTGFVGSTGVGHFLPFVGNSNLPQHVSAGVFLQHKFRQFDVFSLDILNAGQRTAAQGATYRYREHFIGTVSGGLVANHRFFEGVAIYRPVGVVTLSASHQSYFVPYQATGNSASLYAGGRWLHAQASVNQSKSLNLKTTGEQFGIGTRPVSWASADMFLYRTNQTRFVSYVVSQNSRHWSFTESINQQSGRNSYSFGGGYRGNRFSASVGHGIQFLLNGRGYQQVTSVQVSFRIRDTSVNLRTFTDPFGKTLWAADQNSYIQAGSLAEPGQQIRYSGGKYLITGKCIDQNSAPLRGCAVYIGKQIVFSDSNGIFELRVQKDNAVTFTVVPEEFELPGEWKILSAPLTVRPGESTTVVMNPST